MSKVFKVFMILFPGLRPGMRLEQNNTVIRQADSYTWIYIVFAVYHKYVAGKTPPKKPKLIQAVTFRQQSLQ